MGTIKIELIIFSQYLVWDVTSIWLKQLPTPDSRAQRYNADLLGRYRPRADLQQLVIGYWSLNEESALSVGFSHNTISSLFS